MEGQRALRAHAVGHCPVLPDLAGAFELKLDGQSSTVSGL